ncbi:MAG: DHH family phosphoesterase [Clostridia bacterium]|nr:DHH family phosphoesterase [Clostridia bacterium]
MSELRTLQFEEILPYLTEEGDTLVLFHRNPDPDAVGSAYAMKKILETLGSRAWCVCANELPQRLRFLLQGEQDSVLPASIPEDFAVRRIVSVDTASPAQLGELWEIYGGQIDLMIDHHGMGEPYADHYIRPEAAATGEILFDLVRELADGGQLQVTRPICTAIYAAISGDTGCFRYSNVTPDTHLRAADLLSSGIDGADINHRLFESKTVEQLRAQAAGISNLHLFAEGKIAVITFPYALKMALALGDEHLEALVDVARSIMGVQVAISIRQPNAGGVFRVSTRSSGSYDVSELCAQFGGGGHAKAAGCTVTAADMDEAMHKIVTSIREDELD